SPERHRTSGRRSARGARQCLFACSTRAGLGRILEIHFSGLLETTNRRSRKRFGRERKCAAMTQRTPTRAHTSAKVRIHGTCSALEVPPGLSCSCDIGALPGSCEFGTPCGSTPPGGGGGGVG